MTRTRFTIHLKPSALCTGSRGVESCRGCPRETAGQVAHLEFKNKRQQLRFLEVVLFVICTLNLRASSTSLSQHLLAISASAGLLQIYRNSLSLSLQSPDSFQVLPQCVYKKVDYLFANFPFHLVNNSHQIIRFYQATNETVR